MVDNCIDLIYLDPPFNSNHNYAAPIGSKAAGAAFKDTWTLNDIDLEWHGEIADKYPASYKIIDAAKETHGKSMMAYLIYMSIRIIEMHRVLKETGSIYLHCDPTASHYLKLLMDAFFGKKNFCNELIWFKGYRGTPRKKRWQQEHDSILFYTKSNSYSWNDPKSEYKDKNLTRYNKIDADGNQYALIKRQRTDGTVYYGKTYPKGKKSGDVIQIPTLASTAKERTNYPTQKPLALLRRIIEASSNESDLVLDPFCGCATACVAAEELKRYWIGIDISKKAYELIRYRFKNELGLFNPKIIHRTDIPVRESKRSKNIRYTLYGWQGGYCNGCGHHYYPKDFSLDHIMPTSKGGTDDDENMQLLCFKCNSIKSTDEMKVLFARLKKEKFSVNPSPKYYRDHSDTYKQV